MELRHLQHFIAVAEERHFTRAAQRVHIVQSALSSSIRSLEDELQAKLFVRSTRQVQLTPAGQAFLEKAREAMRAIDTARDIVADVEGLRSGSLAIGTVHSLPAFLDLPSLIARFHATHPGVEVRLRQGDAPGLLEQLRTGRLDLAFLPLLDPPDNIVTGIVACEDLAVVTAPGHPLAGRKDITLADLARHSFVDFDIGWGTRPLVDRAFAQAGITRRTAFEVTDLETLVDLVAKGLGIALLPDALAETRRPKIAIAELGPEICWELVVAHTGDETTGRLPVNGAARAFLDLLEFQ
ncbi:HTH-type transcriptional regulator GltC [Hartmannibacter diazotrophicus]|uniref:HTH-type transcriptional regulator GltC n=1 Tax=Hartmannibacter diazotrophicus TaxID=1482074 RepID=A0A2C9D188_9HYPH|nr:LysR family transcriptional regulator [Hartmannibacter diazotrophicus]SON53928.1 HTH-type transcriptional regulator GltC [Hartmannibacter diazotrophicus]